MSLNTTYIIVNLIALSGWLMLFASVLCNIKLPVALARGIVVALAIVYVAMMVSVLPFTGGGFSSLEELASLFAQPAVALVGWVHYLAMDLFIGTWLVKTAKRQHLPNTLVFPSLLFTMMFGPFGLLIFLGGRYAIQARKAEPQVSFEVSKNN